MCVTSRARNSTASTVSAPAVLVPAANGSVVRTARSVGRTPEPLDVRGAALVGEPLLEDRAAQRAAARLLVEGGNLGSNDAHEIESDGAFERTSDLACRGGEDHVGVRGRKLTTTYYFERPVRQRHEPPLAEFPFHDRVELAAAPDFRSECLGPVARGHSESRDVRDVE